MQTAKFWNAESPPRAVAFDIPMFDAIKTFLSYCLKLRPSIQESRGEYLGLCELLIIMLILDTHKEDSPTVVRVNKDTASYNYGADVIA